MSVFVGSAELQAIESVCGTDSDSVLTDLTHLVAGSLVIGDTSGSRARYRLLECIRAYGAEQAAAAGETEALRTRHLHWFLDLAERAEPELGGGAEQPWMAQLEADVDNLRTALSWATESGDSGSALRLSSALVLYWRVRNRFREGRRWLDAAMALSDGNPAPLLTRAQWGAGFMALMLNDLSAAVDHLDASLALAHQTDDTRGRARALLLLGNAWMLRPPSPTPMPAPGVAGMLTESAALARRVGDAWCRAHALSLLGWAHMRSGDTAAARKPLEEALAVARDAGDRQGLRLSLTMLGRLAHSDGDTAAAEAFLFEAVDISDELGDGFGVGAALATLSEMAMRRGDYDGAATLLERAAVLLTEAEPSAFRHLRTRRGGAGPGRHRQRSPLVHRGSGSSGRDQREAGARRAWADGPHRRRRACCAGALRAGSVGRGQPDGRGGAVRARGGRAGWGRPAARLVAEHSALDMRGRLRDTPGVLESLESLACIASEGGRHDHAARLFGAVSALSSAARLARPHHREHRTAIALAATRRELGRSAFRAAFAAGEALSMRHAISYATRGRGARRRPRTGWGSLTQMERAVVAQAIQGLSNAEIAKQLFISPHTAAWHLSQVYAKLGISSRTQLAYHVALRSDAGRNNP
jgi:DNA-binding CsgD family transcriptional regulator